VYSFKKASQSDLVLNIICSEQDLAQQKVALAMCAMNPELKGRQYHVSYDLVKLTSGKMSGRRGRYLLADDLYSELKTVIVEKMKKRYAEKGEDISPEMFNKITHEVAAGAMKYALLSCSCHVQINFDIAKVTDFEDASAPFILYNSTRLTSLVNKFESKVADGEISALPPIDEMDFSLLDNDIEWQLLMEYILGFSAMLKLAAGSKLPEPPLLPDYGTHKVCDFLNFLVRSLSSYYGPKGVRILPTTDGKGGGAAMYPRIYFCKALKQVIDNGLRLLMIEPLEKM
jgi:arginyl-tRNA synthetase